MDKRHFIETILKESGDIVKQSFGQIIPSTKKSESTQIVTEVDIASERILIEHIIKEYPESGIIAEESGYISSKNGAFWIIDPIDGTSNFANALPWFGVMVAYVEDHTVRSAGIYLPMSNEMYSASLGEGTYKNGHKFPPPRNIDLSDSLVSLCFSSSEENLKKEQEIFRLLSPRVLNIRSTNSAYDYAYASEGKLAALINLTNKVWDIAPVLLLAREAGMKVSDIDGSPIHLSLTEESFAKNYTLLISNPHISMSLSSMLK